MQDSNVIHKIKEFYIDKKEKLKALDKKTKLAIAIGIVAIILASIFSISYSLNNKYDVLFSGLDSYDAAKISKELEEQKIDTKIKGDAIYVPKKEVDKLRLELSSSISNGSKGFEIMDEGSGFGMTDDEFKIKKQRMMQGEIEKTIKIFPQVESARVHITQGEESVFSKENKPGKAAVYLNLKTSKTLDVNQVRSIMSLVSASTINVPKQNVEVIDQDMNLLSEGIFDENGNSINNNGTTLQQARATEKELNEDLQNTISNILDPMFGSGKVKVAVNSKIDFDTTEKTEIKIDPEKVISSESRSENTSTNKGQSGSPVDNNMTNTAQANGAQSTTKEESIEYEVGKTETKTISTAGKVEKITASVAINGNLTPGMINKVKSIVSGAIGMDNARGDEISVVSMEFDATNQQELEAIKLAEKKGKIYKIVGIIVGILLIILAIASIVLYIRKKKEKQEEINEFELMNQRLEDLQSENVIFMDDNIRKNTIEDEIKMFASKNPEQATELVKIWLSE